MGSIVKVCEIGHRAEEEPVATVSGSTSSMCPQRCARRAQNLAGV